MFTFSIPCIRIQLLQFNYYNSIITIQLLQFEPTNAKNFIILSLFEYNCVLLVRIVKTRF